MLWPTVQGWLRVEMKERGTEKTEVNGNGVGCQGHRWCPYQRNAKSATLLIYEVDVR